MSGVIDCGSGHLWKCSSGAFVAMAKGVIGATPSAKHAGDLHAALSSALESSLFYIDLNRDVDVPGRRLFAHSLLLMMRDASSNGRELHPNPELYDGYMARLAELLYYVFDELQRVPDPG